VRATRDGPRRILPDDATAESAMPRPSRLACATLLSALPLLSAAAPSRYCIY